MTRLLLVRHGETYWNHEGRVQGHTDVALNPTGNRQAELAAAALARDALAAVYSSPLRRALATARAIARRHHLPVTVDACLREMHLGEMDGMSIEEMRRGRGQLLEQWRKGDANLRLPGGESLQEVQARAWQVVERILVRHHGQRVAVVSHNFVTLCLLCRALDMELALFRRLRPSTGGITELDFAFSGNGASRLVRFNDTCHLGD